jgi:asparagine synthase (glutamine-hydrolysing)
MCGVLGLITRTSDSEFLRSLSTIKHRGPDDTQVKEFRRGEWNVSLGHHRLSIIDLSTGDQPMTSGNDTIIFNGEIYNYKNLGGQFLDGKLKTSSDTEVVLELYRKLGVASVSHLDGFFGYGIYNSSSHELFLARDRWGIKPLFYSVLDDGGIMFSSELFPFLSSKLISREVSRQAVQNYLFWDYAPGEMTFLKKVKKLEPGHFLRWKDGHIHIERYYDPYSLLCEERNSVTAANVWTDVKSAVDHSLVSDVRVGILLSGGIDSSLVAVAAAEKLGAGIPTFSIGFKDAEFDESSFAKIVSNQIKSEHHVQVLDEADLLERYQEIISGLDEPIADPSILPTRILCELARKHVKVVIGGDGGDELFGGYPTYRAHQMRPILDRSPRFLKNTASDIVGKLKIGDGYQPTIWKLKRLLNRYDEDPIKCHYRWMSNTDIKDVAQLSRSTPDVFEIDSRISGHDIQDFMYLDLVSYLPYSVLTKVDRASMAVGLEVRPPFLGNEFVRKAFSIENEQKVSSGETKRILRRVAEMTLPREITERQKKGFAIPLASWLRRPLKPRIEAMLMESPLWENDFLSRGYALQMWEQFNSGRGDHAKTFWALMVLDSWLKRNDLKLS